MGGSYSGGGGDDDNSGDGVGGGDGILIGRWRWSEVEWSGVDRCKSNSTCLAMEKACVGDLTTSSLPPSLPTSLLPSLPPSLPQSCVLG